MATSYGVITHGTTGAIILNAQLFVEPGHADTIQKLLSDIQAFCLTDKEPGCLEYRTARSWVADPNGITKFVVFEKYRDTAAANAHFESEEFKALAAKIGKGLRPPGYPKPGQDLVYETSETLDLETVSLNGGFLTKTLLISPEPWLRERLRVVGYGVVKVLRSENPKFAPGDYAMGLIHKFGTQDPVSAWQLYTIHPWDGLKSAAPGQWPDYTVDIDNFTSLFGLNKIPKNPHISLPLYLGALGGPGQTAYIGLREYAPNMKPGQVIYVSTAAGAVGL
ncbi:hypothetical protein Clacol_005058 [Clathrus columnatus]|uniref:ABM domain-containing protein n=1 Tax=Clathrus columnatus TaxID=1419009 RepID=A0AAV5A932_9AGAM|nr:hypothetical protein Clacol_005058 [Clathrus columnatus]